MSKPINEQIFRQVDGVWMDAQGQVLADVIRENELVIDDRCQFARFYDYVRDLCIYYRVAGGKIVLTFWNISERK